MADQEYRYDTLNRVTVASENSANPATPTCPDNTSVWCQAFTYDMP